MNDEYEKKVELVCDLLQREAGDGLNVDLIHINDEESVLFLYDLTGACPTYEVEVRRIRVRK